MRTAIQRLLGKMANPALKHRIGRLESEIEELRARNRKIAFQVEVLMARQEQEEEPSQRIA